MDTERLSALQRNKALLSTAMAGYVEWVRTNYEPLRETMPKFREMKRAELRDKLPGTHPRTPDAAAALLAGVEVFRAFARAAGVLDDSEEKEFVEKAISGVIEAARAHVEVTSGGDPATRFVELLGSMFAASRVYVRDRKTGKYPSGWKDLGWEDETGNYLSETYRPVRGAVFMGWADETNLYLAKDAAYAAVAAFAQKGTIPFGIKPGALWQSLARSGASLADEGRADTLARVEGKPQRVVQMRRDAIFKEVIS